MRTADWLCVSHALAINSILKNRMCALYVDGRLAQQRGRAGTVYWPCSRLTLLLSWIDMLSKEGDRWL